MYLFCLLFTCIICMLSNHTHFTNVCENKLSSIYIWQARPNTTRFSSTVYLNTVFIYVCVYTHCTFYLCMFVFVLYCVTDWLYEWETDRDWILGLVHTVLELEQLLFAMWRPIPHGCTAKTTWLICCTATCPDISSYWCCRLLLLLCSL